MRFRTNIESVPTLLKVFQSINRVSPNCILNFTPSEVRVICNSGPDGVQVWTTLTKHYFFPEYRVESKYDNQVNLEVSIEMLISVLRSAADADEVVMRLAKRGHDPLLSFAIVMTSPTGARTDMEHEVLIRIIRPAEFEKIREPRCPEPDVHVVLPRLMKMRTVANQMSRMAPCVTFGSSSKGIMTLSVRSDAVFVETTWAGLEIPKVENQDNSSQHDQTEEHRAPSPSSHDSDDDDGDDTKRSMRRKAAREGGDRVAAAPVQQHKVTLDMKSFLRFLASYNVETSTIACVCQGFCVIFYVYIGSQEHAGGVMTFFIPGLTVD